MTILSCSFIAVNVLTLYSILFIPRHMIVAGYYGFRLVSICLTVNPSVVCPFIFSFMDDKFVEVWFGIAYEQISSELSARSKSIFSFLDNNLN